VDEVGSPVHSVVLSWEANPAVGKIDDHGSFTATGSSGRYDDALQVTVEQQLDDELITRTGSVDVTITGTLTQLEIRPALATIAPRATVHFSGTGWDENGVELSGLVWVWGLPDKSLGTIDAFGNYIAAQAPGFYQDAVQVEVIQSLLVGP
jgi:hypothetical protein